MLLLLLLGRNEYHDRPDDMVDGMEGWGGAGPRGY